MLLIPLVSVCIRILFICASQFFCLFCSLTRFECARILLMCHTVLVLFRAQSMALIIVFTILHFDLNGFIIVFALCPGDHCCFLIYYHNANFDRYALFPFSRRSLSILLGVNSHCNCSFSQTFCYCSLPLRLISPTFQFFLTKKMCVLKTTILRRAKAMFVNDFPPASNRSHIKSKAHLQFCVRSVVCVTSLCQPLWELL